ncbi:MAG: DUF502 domain-containing protein [Elusimicrobiota bacterium]
MMRIGRKLKKYLIAGLFAILPLWLTYYILYAIFSVATGLARPFLRLVPGLIHKPFLLETLSFFGTVVILLSAGALLTNMVASRLFLGFELYLGRVPLLAWIYTSIRKLTNLFSRREGEKIARVVMFEYPRKGIYVIGFMTSEVVAEINAKAAKNLVNIFLPTTPNPTSGYLLMLPLADVVPLDISMEDAVKIIVSGGAANP